MPWLKVSGLFKKGMKRNGDEERKNIIVRALKGLKKNIFFLKKIVACCGF